MYMYMYMYVCMYKQNPFTISDLLSHCFCGSGFQAHLIWVLCSGSHKATSKVLLLGLGSHWGLRVLSPAHVFVGRIHYLATVELMAACFFQDSRSVLLLSISTSFISDL